MMCLLVGLFSGRSGGGKQAQEDLYPTSGSGFVEEVGSIEVQ